jgi:hypothetical protein
MVIISILLSSTAHIILRLNSSIRKLSLSQISNFFFAITLSFKMSTLWWENSPLPTEDQKSVEAFTSKNLPPKFGIFRAPWETGDCDCEPVAPVNPSSVDFQNYLYAPHIACVKRKLAGPDPLLAQVKVKKRKTKATHGRKAKKSKKPERPKTKKEEVQDFWKITDINLQERLKACSGRDEMCYSVLNDDWASHPTWASEDSGFVAHRKNVFEEGLHRIEEERHDYDFNIEANQKVIQLLEPIGQQILTMTPAELANFRMPANLGGSSPSIHKRILKKIYGPERGAEVAADLFKDPIAVLPTVLARLKQKDEEWRFTQVNKSTRNLRILSLTVT